MKTSPPRIARPLPFLPRALGTAGLVLLLACSLEVRAQSADSNKAAAEALFQKGRGLLKAGKLEEACKMLDESNKLDAAVGTLYYLGDCQQKRGKLASAWLAYKAAAALARDRHDDKRSAAALQSSKAIEGKVGTLVIVAKETPGLTITVDGQPVPQAVWAAGLPIDAGTHQIQIGAPGKIARTGSVETRDQAATEFQVPELKDAPPKAPEKPTEKPKASPTRPQSASAKSAQSQEELGTQRIVALSVGGFGIVGLGVGAGLGLAAKGRFDESSPYCSSQNVCSALGKQIRSDAFGTATIASVSTGIGVAALVGAAVLWFTAPSAPAERVAVQVRPGIDRWSLEPSAGAWGLAASGHF